MKQMEGIIFDWAGTTVDYGCFAPVHAFLEAFCHIGIEPSLEEVRKPMGMLKIEHIREMLRMKRINSLFQDKHGRSWNEEDVKVLYQFFEKQLLRSLSQYAEPKPGVLETVAKLRERGIKIGSTTGYADNMMGIVVPQAAAFGYAPDCWFSPDSVGGFGRPYPYMIFRNMQVLGLSHVGKVMKVGDTVADIREGKQAGVISVGVIEGSSELGMTEAEYQNTTDKGAVKKRIKDVFLGAGADIVLDRFSDLMNYL